MGPRYVLQLSFNEKITKLLITQPPLRPEIEISANLEFLEFYKFFDVCLTKFKNNRILLNKISH